MKKCYFSLLFPEKCSQYETIQPVFFADLQLEGILKAIVSKYMGSDIRKYFYTVPGSVHTVRFRQNIYRDIEKNPFMIPAFKRYANLLSESEKCFRFYRQVDDTVKQGSYLLLACHTWLEALKLLKQTIGQADLASHGFLELRNRLEEMDSDREFIDFKSMVKEAFSSMEELKLTLLVKKGRLSVLDDVLEPEKDVATQIREFMVAFDIRETEGAVEDALVKNLFPSPLETSPLENTVVDILKRSRPGIFETLKKFSTVSFTLEDDMFCQLKNEFLFYISFYEFEKQLEEAGHALAFPEITENGSLETEDVYDVALAWKNRFSDYNVVKNDISYGDGKSFLVITGPNQGGKTTLARAVGQSVYFMLIGLKAPCRRMKTRFFKRILTHFEVEESVETGAGKLKEELQRLKPMMQSKTDNEKNNFVILNELFTTATTYDARIMAKRVLEHFIGNNCLGVYVTHIQELADEASQPGIQSMVAQIEPGDQAIRTYKILPMAANGLGYADSIVKKYGLDYDEVTKRISELQE